jgi:hypothetical protein
MERRAVHQFSLGVECPAPPGSEDLVALRPQGCVAISRREDGLTVALFESAAVDYFAAVEDAIRAVETLSPDSRVVEITGAPMPMPGLRLETTLSREDFERAGRPSGAAPTPDAPHSNWRARIARAFRSSRRER